MNRAINFRSERDNIPVEVPILVGLHWVIRIARADAVIDEEGKGMPVPIAGWTPAAVANHGPRFLSLTSEQKGLIGKLHKA